jgi:uncharacterized protein YkwD
VGAASLPQQVASPQYATPLAVVAKRDQRFTLLPMSAKLLSGIVVVAVTLLLAGCETYDYAMEEGRSPEMRAAIDRTMSWDTFDDSAMAAAIFAETNRVREAHGLKPLRAYPRLQGAAELQSFTIALTGVASHGNPFAGRARPFDRVVAQGLRPDLVLENVASSLARVPPSGGAVRIKVLDDGTRIRRDDLTGEELPWRSYREVAVRIVQQWMDSPGHRVNILNEEVDRLACGAALSRSPLGGEIIHSVQVFMSRAPSR